MSSDKLFNLRKILKEQNLDAYLIPYTDLHQNEYLPDSAKRLTWLTGFEGSAGLAIVTENKAAIFVDGRYTLQVRQQVDTTLFEIKNLTKADRIKWLNDNLHSGSRIGFDPWLYTKNDYDSLMADFVTKKFTLVSVSENLIDILWSDRPVDPVSPLTLYPECYAGKSLQEKVHTLIKKLQQHSLDYCLINQLDSLCWLLNIRGSDIAFSPLALCLGLIDASGTINIFIDLSKVTPDIERALSPQVCFHPYTSFESFLTKLARDKKTCLIDPDTAPQRCSDIFKRHEGRPFYAPDPCQWLKACKTEVEIQGAEEAHLKDGIALTQFLFWLDQSFSRQEITELSAAEKLLSFRKKQKNFKGPSFETISGSGPNGAIVHYRVTPKTNRILSKGDLYLVDSGGQYLEGTTDVTRTIALGQTPSEKQKQAFTRVLKGHIALAMASFPEGTCGYQLDALARQYLWHAGMDYAHGTGHGVGTYLNVHEGPQNISMAPKRVPLVTGMILSNEPGYYQAGEFGIRIENLVVVDKKYKSNKKEASFLQFRTLTLAPIDLTLIESSLLTEPEKEWLHTYHQRVYENLNPYLDAKTSLWLEKKTRPL